MTESVEQAALRLAAKPRMDWKARAERETAAILSELAITATGSSYSDLLAIGSIAWLQGFNLGAHETLADAEAAFDRVRAAL